MPTTPLARLPPPLLQEQALALEWTYVWLALGGLLLVLLSLAFGYLLVQERWGRGVAPPLLRRADLLLERHLPWLRAVLRRRFDVHRWSGLAATVAGVVIFSAVCLFALIAESWTDEAALYALDREVYAWLLEASDERVTAVMGALTHAADGAVVALVSVAVGAFLLWRRQWWTVLALALSVGVGTGVMHGLKGAFARSRPAEQAAEAAGHAFPSGHAFWAVTLYGFLIYLAWRYARRDAVRLGATVALTVFVVVIGLSRVLLQVHWVSDVAGGFVVGLGWLTFSLFLTHALRASYGEGGRPAGGRAERITDL